MDTKLTLIVGMPRSGTTWIGKIFDSHPDTLYRHEPDNFTDLRRLPLVTSCRGAKTDGLSTLGAQILARRETKVVASRPVFPKRYYKLGERALRNVAAHGAKVLARVKGEFALPEWRNLQRLDAHLVWKSIESTGRVNTIMSALPGAQCIVLVRHPCAQIASTLRGERTRRFESAGDSSDDYGVFKQLLRAPAARDRCLTERDFRAMSPVQRLTWRWVLFNEKALADAEANERCKVFFYEHFCMDPRGTTRAAFEFSELPWSAQTERFLRTSTSNDNCGYYSVAKDPLKAATKWKDELEPAQIDEIMSIVACSSLARYYPDCAVEGATGRPHFPSGITQLPLSNSCSMDK